MKGIIQFLILKNFKKKNRFFSKLVYHLFKNKKMQNNNNNLNDINDNIKMGERSHLWIQPRPTLGKDQLYYVLEKNEFFELLQHISTKNGIASFFTNAFKKVARTKAAIQPLNYRIIILDEENSAIAVAEK